MTHNASSLHGILSSNMLFDGFDYVFDVLFDEDIDTFDGLFDRGISEHIINICKLFLIFHKKNKYMPTAIPETIKSRVIVQWLQGLSRDAIARDNTISTGAVSNIINEWTNALGKYETDALRELAKSLKIADLSPAQCAIGFRTMKILSEHGIDGEMLSILYLIHTKNARTLESLQVK